MKTREKKVVLTGINREQAEEAFAVYADSDAKQQRITSKMDIEITRIREKFQDVLNDLQDAKDKAFETMQAFASENKDQLFAKKKSLEMIHGTVGFRIGTPKLKTRKGFTWPSVTNLLKEFLPTYVRISEEPAKDKIISDRDQVEVAEALVKCGIYVDQDETFFVEPKKEDVSES